MESVCTMGFSSSLLDFDMGFEHIGDLVAISGSLLWIINEFWLVNWGKFQFQNMLI